jgi:SnoaL-like domain
MSESGGERSAARLAIVEEHVRCENRHDLAGLMATFGADARYDDEPWQDHRLGLEGVRSYYTELLGLLPDLAIDIRHRHVGSDAIVLEVTIRGTHLGLWRGACRQQADAWNSHSVLCTPSTHRIDWPASAFTMTGRPCYVSSGCFMSPRGGSDASSLS